jgi:hypothetical protein
MIDQALLNSNRLLTLKDFNGDKVKFYKYLCIKKGLTKGVMLIKGLPRSGKTLFAIHHSRFLRDNFGIPVTMDFKPEKGYGAYNLFDENVLMDELSAVTSISKKSAKWAASQDEIDNLVKGKLKLYGHTIVLDEGTRWLDRRRSSSNVNLLLNDITKQWAHYDILLMVINHFEDELDGRFLRYVNGQGTSVSCSWGMKWPETGEYKIHNRGFDEKLNMTIYGPNVYGLYNSFNPIAMRTKVKM